MRGATVLPIATSELILSTARKLATVFARPLSDSEIDKAAEGLQETHCVDENTVDKAKLLLLIEQNPKAVVFENSATKFLADGGNEHWQSIKQVGKETMLGDFRDFIDTLIKKYGAHARFYVDSDQGDEYFILQPKGGNNRG